MKKKTLYPLLENAFNLQDVNIAKKVIDTRKITMGEKTKKFEKEFAKYLGVKYAVMVNSGSSANLLSVFAAKQINNIKFGDEAIIPSVCWSTSLWPLVQAGLKPVFVDVNLENYNASINEILSKITKKTKVIMLIHVLVTC
jgi:CDP-6-deoxy-D-xylo-4-hexulose-3-dehydrase